jgi:hypothetical protein
MRVYVNNHYCYSLLQVEAHFINTIQHITARKQQADLPDDLQARFAAVVL